MRSGIKEILLSLLIITDIGLSTFYYFSLKKEREVSSSNYYHSVVEIKKVTEDNEYYGSAVCIYKNILVTNYHITGSENNNIYYRTAYDTDYKEANLSFYNFDKDIAVLITEDDTLTPVSISYESIKTGDKAYTFGNTLNQGLTLSSGIIANTEVMYGNNSFICSDALIASGNSGGALLNKNFDLIGITAFYIEGSGLSYSIPIRDVTEFIKNEGGINL